jgi:hypothetical protein
VEALKRRLLPIAHDTHGLLVPVEIRAHIGTALAAGPTDKPRLNVRQPKIIRPRIAADAMEWLQR